jgi:hypothetical protein
VDHVAPVIQLSPPVVTYTPRPPAGHHSDGIIVGLGEKQRPGPACGARRKGRLRKNMNTRRHQGGGTVSLVTSKQLRENLSRCRDTLDEFRPDLFVVWGDDQYENFREEISRRSACWPMSSSVRASSWQCGLGLT